MGPPAAPAAAIAAAAGSALPTKSIADVVASTLGSSSSVYPGIEGSYAKTKASAAQPLLQAEIFNLPLSALMNNISPDVSKKGKELFRAELGAENN